MHHGPPEHRGIRGWGSTECTTLRLVRRNEQAQAEKEGYDAREITSTEGTARHEGVPQRAPLSSYPKKKAAVRR